MPEPATLFVFAATALLFAASPGPNFVFVLSRSLSHGRTDGLMSVLGIGTGALFHTLAAVLGVSALLTTSALAFTIMKTLGAVYLIYLGVKALLSRREPKTSFLVVIDKRAAYRQGLVTMMLNPKVALYFLAFLPQFIDPAKDATGQLLVLGSVQVLAEVSVLLLVALIAGMLSSRLQPSVTFGRAQKWLTGLTYIALGAGLALSGQKR